MELARCPICGGSATTHIRMQQEGKLLMGSLCDGSVGCDACGITIWFSKFMDKEWAEERWQELATQLPERCPFCGELPRLKERSWSRNYEWEHPYNDCILSPYDPNYFLEEGEIRVEAWNRRAPAQILAAPKKYKFETLIPPAKKSNAVWGGTPYGREV